MARPITNINQFVHMLPRFHAGYVFFVDSNDGSNDYNGQIPQYPFRSITYAMTLCVDDRDDCIVVLNGYANDDTDTETNGDDTPIVIDKNGVSIYFQGRNNIVNAIESADSIFEVDATQVTIGVLDGGKVQVAAATAGTASTVVDIQAGSVDCEVFGFDTVSSLNNYDEIITIDATAHRAFIHHNRFIGDGTDTDEGIIVAGTNQMTRIHDNVLIECCTGTATISVPAAAVAVDIRRNDIRTIVASKYGILTHASARGVAMDNMILTHDSHEAKGISGSGLACFNNYTPADIAKSGKILPAIA